MFQAYSLLHKGIDQGLKVAGVKIFFNPAIPDVPVLELSRGVMVTEKFRQEFNAWSLQLFGASEEGYMFDDPTHGKVIYLGTLNYNKFISTLDLEGM